MDPPPGPTTAQRAILADQVSARLGWLGVGFGAGPWPSLPELWSTADITDAQRAGLDPTLRWREGLTAAAARTYGAAPPPAYAATFVLQWLAQLIAYPAAHVAALSPWVLDCSAAPVRFELDPVWWSPRRVVFAADALRPEPVADRRWSRTEAAFSDLAARLALGYAPGVKMSSRQRLGSVRHMPGERTGASRAASSSCSLAPASALPARGCAGSDVVDPDVTQTWPRRRPWPAGRPPPRAARPAGPGC